MQFLEYFTTGRNASSGLGLNLGTVVKWRCCKTPKNENAFKHYNTRIFCDKNICP